MDEKDEMIAYINLKEQTKMAYLETNDETSR